ncbi:MAG: hypothetical protein HZB67_02995 [Candidatus Aenigmarchaeota archaeon]|nr:hypothetical protein [Candidatus Aenigmarchaeota archaeon]
MDEKNIDVLKLHKKSDKKFSLILAKPKNRTDISDETWNISKKIVVKKFSDGFLPLYLLDSYKNVALEKLTVNNPSAKPVNAITTLSNELCKILGALCADGHISTKSKPEYLIQIVDADFEALNAFDKWIEKVFGISYKIKKEYSTNSWRIDINNKVIARYFVHIFKFPTGRKSHFIQMPEEIKKSNLSNQKAFLTGIMTFDGAVNLNKNIELITRSRRLHDDVITVLDKLKMNYKNGCRDKNGFWRFHIHKPTKTELRKWLSLFENRTEKRKKIFENINGFNKIPNSEEDVIRTFNKIFPRKNRSLTSLVEFYSCVKELKMASINEIAEKLSVDPDTIRKYRAILKDCGIIYERNINNDNSKIEVIFNDNIDSWKIPKR